MQVYLLKEHSENAGLPVEGAQSQQHSQKNEHHEVTQRQH